MKKSTDEQPVDDTDNTQTDGTGADDDWDPESRRTGMAIETRLGLGLIVVLLCAFAFVAWRKYDLQDAITARGAGDAAPPVKASDSRLRLAQPGSETVAPDELGFDQPGAGDSSVADGSENTPVDGFTLLADESLDTPPDQSDSLTDSEAPARAGAAADDFTGFFTDEIPGTDTAPREATEHIEWDGDDSTVAFDDTETSDRTTPVLELSETFESSPEFDDEVDAEVAEMNLAADSPRFASQSRSGVTEIHPSDEPFAPEPLESASPEFVAPDNDPTFAPASGSRAEATFADSPRAAVTDFETDDVALEFEPVPVRRESPGPEQPQRRPQTFFRFGESAPHGADSAIELQTADQADDAEPYVVCRGDSFWTISKQRYGSSRYYMALAEFNSRHVPDPARLRQGSRIRLPAAEMLESRFPELFANRVRPRVSAPSEVGTQLGGTFGLLITAKGLTYRVRRGDTLSAIAQRHLGRASRSIQIFEMNRQRLKDPDNLTPGLILLLPRDASDVGVANRQ